MLKVDNLHFSYGKLVALRGVSFEVNEGEIVSIIGPNGSGKSTSLLAVSGVLKPAAGSISFAGESLAGLTPETIARRGISMVPEGRHVFGKMTVDENLRVATFIGNGRDDSEAEIEAQYARFPRLKERQHSPAGKLSGGEQQMLVIARALLTRPRLMTIDEPSLGLAPQIVDRVYEVLTELREKQGVTLLINEQNTERATRHADRVYVIRNGAIELSGKAADLADGEAIQQAYFGFGDD